MKRFKISAFILVLLGLICLVSCEGRKIKEQPPSTDFSSKIAPIPTNDSLIEGKTYLSVYSQIYSFSEDTQHDLTATVSLRNMDENHPIYISRADYYGSKGDILKKYLNQPIKIEPLETLEIVIEESDKSGGTGANFIFEWKINTESTEPLFEAVMISTLGQQGLSFTTTGKRIQ